MKWLNLILLLSISLSIYAPMHIKPKTKLKTLSELEFEKQLAEKQRILEAADSAAFAILDKYKREKTDAQHAAFVAKVMEVADSLDIHFSWLVGIMHHESRLNHKARNSIGAVGLIQFLPVTARGLGTSTYRLRQMTDIEQLEYVYRFYKHAKGKLNKMTDLYLYAFFPISILNDWGDYRTIKYGKLSASIIAKQNPGLDLNRDGKVTVDEVRRQALRKVPLVLSNC